MKAAVWVDANKIIIEERNIPKLLSSEVLVKSRAVGVCGTDIHIYSGQYPGISPPRVLGHEACGVIEKVGGDVIDINVGDRVVIDPILWCGDCYFCRQGQFNLCAVNGARKLIGFSQDGGYAEYFIAPATNLHKISSNLSFEEAALVDTLACPINALSKINLDLNGTVVVIGAGSAGLMFIQLAKLKSAHTVIAVEPNEYRRNLANALGVNMALNPNNPDFFDEIRNSLPESNTIIVEAGGTAESINLSLKLGSKQSTILQFGYISNKPIIISDLGKVLLLELKIIGSVGYQRGDYEKAINLIESGKIHVKPLITHTFELEKIKEAFQIVKTQSDNIIKAVILQD